MELADPPRIFLGIARNPGPEPEHPKEKPIINAPKMHFQRLRATKRRYKWQFRPKFRLKSTAGATNGRLTTPTKKTLVPGTQGPVKTGVPFGLDLAPTDLKTTKNLQI